MDRTGQGRFTCAKSVRHAHRMLRPALAASQPSRVEQAPMAARLPFIFQFPATSRLRIVLIPESRVSRVEKGARPLLIPISEAAENASL